VAIFLSQTKAESLSTLVLEGMRRKVDLMTSLYHLLEYPVWLRLKCVHSISAPSCTVHRPRTHACMHARAYLAYTHDNVHMHARIRAHTEYQYHHLSLNRPGQNAAGLGWAGPSQCHRLVATAALQRTRKATEECGEREMIVCRHNHAHACWEQTDRIVDCFATVSPMTVCVRAGS
jgi:hypothetical protein